MGIGKYYFLILILVVSLFLFSSDGEGLTIIPMSLDKSEYGVGDQPVVTVTHPISNLDPNQIDSINVDVRALVSQGYVGTLIATVAVPETGPDTGVFSGGLNTITLDDMTDDATGLDHTLIKVIFSSGVAQASLIAPPEPEPEPEPDPQPTPEPDPVYGSSGLYCPGSSGGYPIVDWSPSESFSNYWTTFWCGYEGYDSNNNLRYVVI